MHVHNAATMTYFANILSGFADSTVSAAAGWREPSVALPSTPTTASVKQIVKPSCWSRPSTTSSLDCVKMTRRLTSTKLTHRWMSTMLFCIATQSQTLWHHNTAFLVLFSLPDNLRDPGISRDSFCRLLKTHLFTLYWSTQCMRGCTRMCYRYISQDQFWVRLICSSAPTHDFTSENYLLTYLLTYLLMIIDGDQHLLLYGLLWPVRF